MEVRGFFREFPVLFHKVFLNRFKNNTKSSIFLQMTWLFPHNEHQTVVIVEIKPASHLTI